MKKSVFLAALLAMMLVSIAPASAQTTSGPTIAPDLLSVVDVTATNNDYNGSGTNDTTAVFTFDEPTEVVGCCAGFQLIHTDTVNNDPLKAIDVLTGNGTAEITLAFEGQISVANTARGTIDKNIVQTVDGGSKTNNPPQAAPVVGTTNAPDLVSVRQDLNTLLYTFDQSIAEDDDVIQNTSGLRFYTEDAITYGAQAVEQVDDNTLRAVFDLPQGTTVADAVGGFVTQGTVVGADVNGDGTFEPNELDETLVGEPLGGGFTTCPPSTVDETNLPSGQTVAPDLQFVGNFRQGPYTAELEPTTCVDYDFDQAAYLAGGNRTSFHLVPTDGGPVLDATGMKPEDDVEGDDKITVQYLGLLDESDFARGYVDGNVVTSNVNGDGPYNVAQADAISNGGNTDDPDLETISEKSDKKLFFEFDEDLDQEDVVQDTAGLRFYTEAGDVYTASVVKKTNREDVLVAKFDLPKGVSARDAVGGLVVQGTVVAPDDDGDGAKEPNSFDEVRKSSGKIQKDTVSVID